MKKRFLLRSLSSLISLSVVLFYGICVFADETDDQEFAEEDSDIIVVEDSVSVDVDYDDYELAEGFIYQKLSLGKPVCYNKFDYEANLSGYELVVYNYLLPFISEIANGERTSTVITIPEDVLSIDLTAEDLGLEDLTTATNQEITAAVKNHFPVDTTKLWLSFIETCPYEMYWYDKTKGCSTAYKLSRKGSSYIHLYNYKVTFCVSEEYQDGDDKTVNSVFGEAVNSAAANVRSIINEYAGLDDYHKLLAYNNKICLLTDYNYPAYENTDTPYGNPWQLIWVFDGDDSTKVVCEGYAKAFQYLCDNSAFRDDSLYVLSLYGSCNDGGHMWNLVHMDDGNNYLVDVTHSDPGGDGNIGIKNFLKGATSGSASSGYTVNNKLYKYNPALVDYYGEDTVALASSDYTYVDPDGKHSIVLSSVSNGSAVLSKDSALEGEEITVTVTPKEGYELSYITVNDTVIDGNTFTMPSENVFINVVCAKIRYWISVDFDPYGGGVSYPGKLPEGATATINAIPRNGYVLDYIKVDDEIITGNTFTMPAHDVNVYVAFKKASYSIYVGITGPGSIETSDNKANPGDVVTITSTPDEGYKLDSISVYDHDYNLIRVKNNAFTMPESDVTIYATFVKADYSVTLSAVQNGTATLTASVAQMGDTITVTVSPATGYELDSIKVNGTKISGKSFTMTAADVTVEVAFKAITYTVTLTYDAELVAVEGIAATDSSRFGDKYEFKVTPVEGYEILSVKVNGAEISAVDGIYTVTQPDEDIEIVIELSEIYVPKSGWITEDGNKYYFEDDNPVKGWYRIAGSWYFFNADGVMQTGWLKAGSAWYYLDGSGVMVTGWLSSGGKWYYLKSSGVMATGWNKISGKWYYLESSGTMVSGWKRISGKWYYFESSGSMVTGWKQIGGKWYVFDTSGAMKTGWYKEGNTWYYLKSDGSMATGWLETGGKWYYFYSSGAMASNITIDGYKLGNDGAWIK